MAAPPPPPESWGLDPLFFANVKVTAGEVVGEHPALVPAEGTNRGVHFFHGRPTKRYELMGHVVTLTVRDSKTIFTLDDGTGCLECVVWLNSAGDDGGATLTAGGGAVSNGDFSIDLRGLRLGALVRCQGRVAEYREKLQLKVDAVQRCDDANAEPLFWLDHARCVANIHAERAGDAGERGVSRDKPREGD